MYNVLFENESGKLKRRNVWNNEVVIVIKDVRKTIFFNDARKNSILND